VCGAVVCPVCALLCSLRKYGYQPMHKYQSQRNLKWLIVSTCVSVDGSSKSGPP
jgi:hypothetical protein